MRTFVFLCVLAATLTLEWLALFRTGLFEKIMAAPFHLVTDAIMPLLASGSTWDFVVCVAAVLMLAATGSAVVYAFIYMAYLLSVIVSSPFAKD